MHRTTVRISFSLLATALAVPLFAANPDPALPPGMEVIDLWQQLGAGEQREFGEGEHRIVARRSGEVVLVTMPGEADGSEPASVVECHQGDRCLVLLGGGDALHRMVVLKTSSGEAAPNGDPGEQRVMNMVFSGDAAPPANFTVEGSGGFEWHTQTDDQDGVQVVRIETGDAPAMLHCPKGDTHMQIEPGDDELEFRCPKHDLVLERPKPGSGHQVHKVIERRIIKGNPKPADGK